MTTRTRYALSIAAAALAALAGVAFAQEAGAPLETPSGANPLLLLVIGGAVAYLRSTPLFSKIDGPATVPLFAMVVGGVVGAGGELIGAIEVDATAVLGAPWSGAAAGILAPVARVIGGHLPEYLKPSAEVPATRPAGLGRPPLRPTAPGTRETSEVTEDFGRRETVEP